MHLSGVVDIREVLVPGERFRKGDLSMAGHDARCSPYALLLREVFELIARIAAAKLKREGGNASRLAALVLASFAGRSPVVDQESVTMQHRAGVCFGPSSDPIASAYLRRLQNDRTSFPC